MKKYYITIITFCIVIILCGCSAFDVNNDRKLYNAGLDIISVMDEMVQSEEYASIYGMTDTVTAVLETVNTNDHDTPVAVYRISVPELKDVLKLSGVSNEESWDELSDNLKQQVIHRTSVIDTLVSMINVESGSKQLAFSSIYTAMDQNDALRMSEDTTFLYVFEIGTPIMVTFTEKGDIHGRFVFIEDASTLSEVRSVLDKYLCAVESVDIDK